MLAVAALTVSLFELPYTSDPLLCCDPCSSVVYCTLQRAGDQQGLLGSGLLKEFLNVIYVTLACVVR